MAEWMDEGVLAAILLKQIGKLFAEGGDFGDVADLNVGIMGVLHGVVLVVFFAAIEGLEGDELGDDGFGEDVGFVQLVDVGLGDVALGL